MLTRTYYALQYDTRNTANMYLGTPQKPIKENIFKSDHKQNIYKILNRGDFICGLSNPEVRKIIFELKRKFNMNIQTLTCDCEKHTRKHNAYYYEWATEYKDTINDHGR